jgi:hypothetical protein
LFLKRLVKTVRPPAEALDTSFTQFRDFSYAEWARIREVLTPAVHQNVNE